MSRDDNLFSRWSQRKRAVAAEEQVTSPAEDDVQRTEEAAPDIPESELLEQLGLPDPDTLKKGDDFTAFLQSHVPAALRRRALRRLWASDPVLANLDGLLDHGEDYTDAATVPAAMTSAYRAGQGYLREILAEDTEDEADEAPGPEVMMASDDAPQSTAETAAQPDEPIARPDDTLDDTPDPPRPRRMTFRQA